MTVNLIMTMEIMTNTMTDKREIRVDAFETDGDDPTFKEIQELVNLHVPEEFKDKAKFVVDTYGYVSCYYERLETDEEYNKRRLDEDEKSKYHRQRDAQLFISICNKYNLETLIPGDLRVAVIEEINYDN